MSESSLDEYDEYAQPTVRPGRLGTVLAALAGLMVWGIVMMYLSEAGARHLGLPAIPNSREIAGYLMAGLIAFGLGATQAYGRHVEIDFFTAKLTEGLRRWHARLCNLAGVAAGLLIAYAAYKFGQLNYDLGTTSASSLHVPIYIPQIVLGVGGIAFAVEHLIDLLERRATVTAASAPATDEAPRPSGDGTGL